MGPAVAAHIKAELWLKNISRKVDLWPIISTFEQL